jgi:hypothetical protein
MSDPHMLVVKDVCYVFTDHDVGFGINDWVMPDWRIFKSTELGACGNYQHGPNAEMKGIQKQKIK